jgi:hypothetical protein
MSVPGFPKWGSSIPGWPSEGIYFIGDFDGDNADDVAYLHPEGRWYIVSGHNGAPFVDKWWGREIPGWPGNGRYFIGDFDGDGADDIAFLHSEGRWYIVSGRSGALFANWWGPRIPTWHGTGRYFTGDFDGDGADDIAFLHPDGGRWYSVSGRDGSYNMTANPHGVRQDCSTYFDQYGLMQPGPSVSSGNGLLFTAEYIMALMFNNELDEEERQRLIKVYNSCELEPGLLMRSPIGAPFNQDQEGPDDYVGAAAASYFLRDSLAERILKYGNEKGAYKYADEYEEPDRREESRLFWGLKSLGGTLRIDYVYNNIHPEYFTLSSYLGRQISLLCHLKFAAGEIPTETEKWFWCRAVEDGADAKKEDHDSWILSWLLVRTMDERDPNCNEVATYWKEKLQQTWPGGIGEVLCAYFQNQDHPLKHVGIGF